VTDLPSWLVNGLLLPRMKNPSLILMGAGFLFFACVTASLVFAEARFIARAHHALARVLQSFRTTDGSFGASVQVLPPDERWSKQRLTTLDSLPAVDSTIAVLIDPAETNQPVRRNP